MSESSGAVDGGTSASAAVPEGLAAAIPVKEGGGETLLEDAPRETEGSALR